MLNQFDPLRKNIINMETILLYYKLYARVCFMNLPFCEVEDSVFLQVTQQKPS